MIKDVESIREELIGLLKEQLGPLKVNVDTEDNFEVIGTIPAQQGKKMVDGFYFSSIKPKPKDVRFYFFPSYTHADQFEDLSADLSKAKKGKSCFHIKYLTPELKEEIKEIIAKGVKLYQNDQLLAS